MQGKFGRGVGEGLHDEAAVEIDDLLVFIDFLPGFFQDFPRLWQAHHNPDILQNIHGGVMNILKLILREKFYRFECVDNFLFG